MSWQTLMAAVATAELSRDVDIRVLKHEILNAMKRKTALFATQFKPTFMNYIWSRYQSRALASARCSKAHVAHSRRECPAHR